jgi:hypothetical protein
MRLHELLAELPDTELEGLKREHLRDQPVVSRGELLVLLEGILNSPVFVSEFISNRVPPAFLICELLLDTPELSVPYTALRTAVIDAAAQLRGQLEGGEVLPREGQLSLYRKVLLEVRERMHVWTLRSWRCLEC